MCVQNVHTSNQVINVPTSLSLLMLSSLETLSRHSEIYEKLLQAIAPDLCTQKGSEGKFFLMWKL